MTADAQYSVFINGKRSERGTRRPKLDDDGVVKLGNDAT